MWSFGARWESLRSSPYYASWLLPLFWSEVLCSSSLPLVFLLLLADCFLQFHHSNASSSQHLTTKKWVSTTSINNFSQNIIKFLELIASSYKDIKMVWLEGDPIFYLPWTGHSIPQSHSSTDSDPIPSNFTRLSSPLMALKLEGQKHCLPIRQCLYLKCLLRVNSRYGTGLDIASSRYIPRIWLLHIFCHTHPPFFLQIC